MKPRVIGRTVQHEIYEGGNNAYDGAQAAARLLRNDGFTVSIHRLTSAAGSWADSVYIMTNAPVRVLRKALATQHLNILDTRKTIGRKSKVALAVILPP